jgi:hypothetical protein
MSSLEEAMEVWVLIATASLVIATYGVYRAVVALKAPL